MYKHIRDISAGAGAAGDVNEGGADEGDSGNDNRNDDELSYFNGLQEQPPPPLALSPQGSLAMGIWLAALGCSVF